MTALIVVMLSAVMLNVMMLQGLFIVLTKLKGHCEMFK